MRYLPTRHRDYRFNSLLPHVLILCSASILLSFFNQPGNVDPKLSAVQLVLIIFLTGYTIYCVRDLLVYKPAKTWFGKIYWFTSMFGFTFISAAVEIIFYIAIRAEPNFIVYSMGSFIFFGLVFGSLFYYFVQPLHNVSCNGSPCICARYFSRHMKCMTVTIGIGLLLLTFTLCIEQQDTLLIFITTLIIFTGVGHGLHLFKYHFILVRKILSIILLVLIFILISLYGIIIYNEVYFISIFF